MQRQVVVVGGGISGLTCAYRLQRAGCDVLLLEEEDSPGGVMKSRRVDGFLHESGPNSFQSAPEILSLVDELGLTGEMVTAPATAPRYVYFRRQLQRFPMSPPSLLSTRLLSGWGKVRLFLEPFARPRPRREESVSDFVTRRFGREVLEAMVNPFVSGVYAGDPARLSVASTFPMLAELEEKYGGVLAGFLRSRRNAPRPRPKRMLCSFRDGLGTLPRALAERLGPSWRGGVRTIGVRHGPGGYAVATVREGRHEEMAADAVVLATPAFVAAELLAGTAPDLSSLLSGVEYPPLAVVCLAYDRSTIATPIDGFGFLVPRGEGVRILGCLWNSSLFPGRAPEGKVCLTVFVGGATDPGVGELGEEELLRTVHQGLSTVLRMSGVPRVVALHRYSRAIPQYTIGHPARVRRIEALLQGRPGLFLAGNYLRGVSVPDRVREAEATARLAGSFLGSRF